MAGAYFQLIEGEPDPAAPSVPYAHTLFAPNRTVTRAELAVLVARAADLGHGSCAGAFADVPTGAWFTPSVCALVGSRVIEPADYPGGKFRPNVPATRRQLAAWAGRVLALDGAPLSDLGKIQGLRFTSPATDEAIDTKPTVPYSQVAWTAIPIPSAAQARAFPDLPASIPGYSAIERAVAYGLVQGFPDGSFHPEASATRAQAAKVIVTLANELTRDAPSVAHLQAVAGGMSAAIGQAVTHDIPETPVLPVAEVARLYQGSWGLPAMLRPTIPGSKVSGASIVAAEEQAGVLAYTSGQTLLSATGIAAGTWVGRLQEPLLWYDQALPGGACRPVFLGTTVAELDCVSRGQAIGWDGKPLGGQGPYYGAGFVEFARRDGVWKVVDGDSYRVLPPWYLAKQFTVAPAGS